MTGGLSDRGAGAGESAVPATVGVDGDAERDRRALRSVAVQFFANGTVYATLIPRLPEIRERVDISIGTLGLVLTLGSAASLIGSLSTARVIARLGSRRVMIWGAVCSIGFLPVIGVATSPVLLALALFGLLFFDVFIDVAMNMQGSVLSARRHTPVMNRLHGLWSLGSVAGGALTVLTLRAGVSTPVHLTVVAGLLLMALLVVAPGLLRTDEAPQLDGPPVPTPPGPAPAPDPGPNPDPDSGGAVAPGAPAPRRTVAFPSRHVDGLAPARARWRDGDDDGGGQRRLGVIPAG